MKKINAIILLVLLLCFIPGILWNNSNPAIIIGSEALDSSVSEVFLSTALGEAASSRPARYSILFTDTFDTVISFIGYANSQEEFDEWTSQIHAMFLYLHKLYDRYHSYEDEGIVSLYTVNEKAGKEPVKVNELLFSLLVFGKNGYEKTNGKTNIAMGRVLDIWHNYREEGLNDPANAKVPDLADLQEAAKHTAIEALVLDSDNKTVYFSDPLLQLDVGAIAKGYATEIVSRMLIDSGFSSFIISAGGNVRAGAAPLDGRKNWGIGIQTPDGDPFSHSDISDVLYLTNGSVVTSGDYQRFYTVDGTRYCHLINPDTLMPDSEFRSTTIITEKSEEADLLSTAVFLMSYEEGLQFVNSLDGVEAIWLLPNGSELMTEGAKRYTNNLTDTSNSVPKE